MAATRRNWRKRAKISCSMDRWMASEFPEKQPCYGELNYTSDLPPLDREAELVVEGIAEDMAVKVNLWRSLAGVASRGGILCSSTSGLSISEMGRQSGFPAQVIGTHFWNPPHLMPLVEVVAGSGTAEETMQATLRFCRGIGKQPVRVNFDAPGFIGNRMLHALWREAIEIVERGIASAEDVDTVAKMTFGLRLPVVGPLENMDLVGLDLIHTIHRYLLADLAANRWPRTIAGRAGSERPVGHEEWLRVLRLAQTRAGGFNRGPGPADRTRAEEVIAGGGTGGAKNEGLTSA